MILNMQVNKLHEKPKFQEIQHSSFTHRHPFKNTNEDERVNSKRKAKVGSTETKNFIPQNTQHKARVTRRRFSKVAVGQIHIKS